MSMQTISEFKFLNQLKLHAGAETTNEIIQAILKYNSDINIYKLTNIDNFICELYQYIFPICLDIDKFNEYIKFLFLQNKEYLFRYESIFYKLVLYDGYSDKGYKRILQLNMNDFKSLILKYSNCDAIYNNILCDKLIGETSTTKNEKFNIANKLLYYLFETKSMDVIQYTTFEKINILISNSTNLIDCMKKSVELLDISHKNKKFQSINIRDIIHIESDTIPRNLLTSRFISNIWLLSICLIKSLQQELNKVLDYVYCRSNIYVIDIINEISTDLITISESQLTKIVYYGRYEVFNKLYEIIPTKLMTILQTSNPLDISKNVCHYRTDVLNDPPYWGNDEDDRQIVGKKNHLKLFKSIFNIKEQYNLNHINWSIDIQRDWLKKSFKYKDLQYICYFITYQKLLEIFNIKIDISSKETIQTLINLVGKKYTWNIIKNEGTEDILDIFFNVNT